MASIDFIYDVPLPNAYAATVQSLKTGLALSELGHGFTFSAGPLAGPADAFWAGLGVPAASSLRLRSLFPTVPRSPALRAPIRRALIALRGISGDIAMSRGRTAFDVAPMATLKGRPFVYEVHRLAFLTALEKDLGGLARANAPLPTSAKRLRAQEARLMAAADGIVFLTEALREEASRWFDLGARPHIVAPSGVTVAPTAPADPGDGPTADMVILGKIERRKGVDVALHILRHLPDRTLLVIGDGPFLGEARALARALGVAARVEFAGRLPHGAVAAALARARIGLCPLPGHIDSVSERFTSPMKLLEMFAAGMPVVASDLPSVRAIATHGRDALLAPADAPEAQAKHVAELLNNAELRARLGAAARTRALDFSWTRRAERIGELARRLHTARTHRSPKTAAAPVS